MMLLTYQSFLINTKKILNPFKKDFYEICGNNAVKLLEFCGVYTSLYLVADIYSIKFAG